MDTALELRNIRKAFPGIVAVDDVSLDLYPGEIHALVGENGAGKSTLSNIAFGELTADAGTVRAVGTVGLVHQHFELVGRLRVWQNIVLGREPRHGARVDVEAAKARVRDLAARNGLEIDPDALVEDLPIGVQQRVELLRELEREPTVLLLDEPTAALAPAEIGAFFETITALAKRGTAIMIVTHKLQEVIAYSTRVSVMRHGKIVGGMETGATTVDAIAKMMVGGELPEVAQREPTTLTPCLTVVDVNAGTGGGSLNGLSFEVRAGEIVGIAGVEGNGQTALADAIAGMAPYAGTIEHRGTLGTIPQDRHKEALVMSWSIVDNVVFGRQHDPGIQKGMLMDRTRARADAQAVKERFDVRAASLDAPIKTLSGGNQQKVVVGRALIDDPRLVIAYNPTRGIDVGAAALVQSRLVQARNAGAAILLISFELDEILTLADRILVLYRGSIVGNFERADADRNTIGRLMAGSRSVKRALNVISGPLGAIVIALVLAALAMIVAGVSPVDGFSALFGGALGSTSEIAETLTQTTFLLFPALGVCLAFRAGLFNIGAEGQIAIGGLMAGAIGAHLNAPPIVTIPALLIAGVAGGFVWGGIAGWMKSRFGANEVISTLMLNFVATLLASYLVSGPLKSPLATTGAETAPVLANGWLPTLIPDTRLTIALLIAIAVAVLLQFVFTRTVFGYELRAVGEAPEAARRNKVNIGRLTWLALAISGGIAGMGGAAIVTGELHRFNTELSPGYGFTAIAVALVGDLNPLWVCVAALGFGILESGGLQMQAIAQVPKDAIHVIEGIIILILAARRYVATRKVAQPA